ncbi:MAG: hypothetical protein LC754_10275 [Acidobacteria bacterium]|nr:hypothetical protein [Acidobacteriota bacterium]
MSGEQVVPVEGIAATAADERGARGTVATVAASARKRLLMLVVGALVIGATFWVLQFSTKSICCGDYDSYYHFRWSRMLWEGIRAGHFPPTFDALPLTTLNQKDYVDHHFLFHVMQIPFTWFADLQQGAKIGTWLFACLAVFSCYWLVVRYRLSYPLLWLLAILGSAAPFLYRIHMGKAMSVSIVMLAAGIHLLFQRKYLWLLPLAFIFALTYDMVFLLWVAVGFWLLITLWTERALNRNVWWALGALGLVIVGTGLGYVVNPYFPRNVQLVYEHLAMKVTTKDFSTPVGGEWYPYNTWEFLQNCFVAIVAMLAGYLAFRDSDKKATERTLFFLLFSTFLMVVNMRWRRFSEYWPPFAILFAAFALEPFIARARLYVTRPATSSDDGQAQAETNAARVEKATRARVWEYALVSLAVVVLCAFMGWFVYVTSKDIAGMPQPDLYRGGMEWISKNVPPGELVFNSDWDDFPKLFFYDPHRPWVAGLDPTYLLDKNPDLMDAYARIGKGEEENPGPVIREKFCLGEGDARRCARYVFTDQDHEPFYNNALDSGWFDEVYRDGDCIILRVRDERGAPPPDAAPNDEADTDDDPSDESEEAANGGQSN